MPPNIVYLHSHDTGRHIEPYGYATPTPNLTRFAGDAAVFRNAHAVAPTCSPSRAALLTGQPPHVCGMLGLTHLGFRLHDETRTLPHHLRRVGYRTALFGVEHVQRTDGNAPDRGYDDELGGDKRDPKDTIAKVGPWLETQRQPFFLNVGFFDTHHAYAEPAVDEPRTDPDTCKPFDGIRDTAESRRDLAAFNTTARRLDAGIGLVLEKLDSLGLADNTIVLVTTDHGPPVPGMKCQLTDAGTGVMLMLRGPGVTAGVSDRMVSHLDVVPTLCELAGVPLPEHLHERPFGGSLFSVEHEAIFGEVTYHAAYEPKRSVRTQRYKYIRRFDDRDRPVLPNYDRCLSRDVWQAAGGATVPPEPERLFDLMLDPGEHHNLVHDPAHVSTLDELRQRLAGWMRETDDPLLDGPVSPPVGASFWPVDAESTGSEQVQITEPDMPPP